MPLSTQFDYYILKEYNNIQDKLSLKKISHKITTRKTTQDKYHIPNFNNSNGKRTASYLIPKKLNELPYDIRTQFETKNLKKKLKNFFTLPYQR